MPRGRPRKIQSEIPSVIEIPIAREPEIRDPRFGFSRPAPKPSAKKKGRPSDGENIE